MERRFTLTGTYQPGTGHMSRNWAQVSADHRDEFASMGRCAKGSFNILLDAPYQPPDEDRYREMARERGKSVGR